MKTPRVVVVGAGMGGLAAAIDLARRGADVTLLERAATPGGKMRQVAVGNAAIDAGPTVFTMRWVFEGLFADAGARLEDRLKLHPAETLARHAWRGGGALDLFVDIDRSADAIAAFAGPAEAKGYRDFCARSRDIYRTLVGPFMMSPQPSAVELVRRVGLRNLPALLRTEPTKSLWTALGEHFRDPRLRQLFGRYATYCGSSPMRAPATLMLVAHVEQDGVWLVEGGMKSVADAMRLLAEEKGARFRFGAHVDRILVEGGRARGVELAGGERIAADAIVFNGDAGGLAKGLAGPEATRAAEPIPVAERSLSAITWCLDAPTSGFPLAHHSVFFAEDYEEEFDAIFRRRSVCEAPTVYICAQDRGEGRTLAAGAAERLLVLINAPADGDARRRDAAEMAAIEARAFGLLSDCGLEIARAGREAAITTPADFEALFPGSGGALYGRANHGAFGSFRRPASATPVPGLYACGGTVHPGAGIPMSSMSGRLAAARLLEDFARRSR